jgi:hypothetical protein
MNRMNPVQKVRNATDEPADSHWTKHRYGELWWRFPYEEASSEDINAVTQEYNRKIAPKLKDLYLQNATSIVPFSNKQILNLLYK